MLQHFREKTFLLILLFVAGAGGCKNDSAEEKEDEKPDYPDYKVYFNKLDQQQAFETIAGTWQIFSESKDGGEFREIEDWYVQYKTFSEVIECRDSVYTMKTVRAEKNDVGYEWVTESNTQTRTFWMMYREENTLCFTSPEYPPRFSWKAMKIDEGNWEFELKYEKARQNTLFPYYLSDVKCLPEEVVSRGIVDNIGGQWKLMKDIQKEIDYSCDNIIYEYQSDSTLVVTSDRPEYPSGTFRYIPDPTCNFGYSHPYHLTIDGVPVYSNGVLEKIMFFGDSLQNESIIFVRIK